MQNNLKRLVALATSALYLSFVVACSSDPTEGGGGVTAVCTDDICYVCKAAEPVAEEPAPTDQVTELAYDTWDLRAQNPVFPGCGDCGANNNYFACAFNGCACNVGAVVALGAGIAALPEVAAVVAAGWASVTAAQVLAALGVVGVAAAAFKDWANSCMKFYCNVEITWP